MKGIMRKALALFMMLAMVAGIIAVPNVDAKAATEKTFVLVLAQESNGPVYLDLDCWNNGENGNLTTTATAVDVNWGRDLYTMTQDPTNKNIYTIKVSGPLDKNACLQFVLDNCGGAFKCYLHDSRDVYNSTDTLYFTANNTGNYGWDTQIKPSATDPNAITAAEVNETIASIGKVELTDDCKNKIAAAETAVASYKGSESDLDLATLNAAKTEWNRLIGTGAAGTVTLYVKPSNWESVHLWAWDMDGKTVVKDEWPGTKLEAMEDNAGWYSCTFEISAAINALFNEKGDDAKKTADWKYLTAGEYWVTIADDNNYETSKEAPTGWKTEDAGDVEVNPTPPTTPSTTPSTTDKYQQKYTSAQLVGNFAALKDKLKNCKITSDWDVAGDAGNMEYLGNGVYAITLTFDKTTEDVVLEYKVAFNHSWDVSIGLQSVDTAFTTNNGGNITVTIPAGSTSFKIIASEKDTVVYDSIQYPTKVAEYEEIAKMADSSLFVLYVVILVAGCAMVAVASKKRFAK